MVYPGFSTILRTPKAPMVPATGAGRGAGEVAVGHRGVQRRGEELEVAVPADHRVQAQVHPVATMAFRWMELFHQKMVDFPMTKMVMFRVKWIKMVFLFHEKCGDVP